MPRYNPNIEQFPDHPCAVIYEGRVISYLNPALIKKNGLTEAEVENLKLLHCKLYTVHLSIEATDDPIQLKHYANLIEHYEYELQKCWHFHRTYTMHRWFDVPKCKCPKMDNEENMGTKYRIINAECPLHGYGVDDV